LCAIHNFIIVQGILKVLGTNVLNNMTMCHSVCLFHFTLFPISISVIKAAFLESFTSTRLPSSVLNYQSISRGSNPRQIGLESSTLNPSTTEAVHVWYGTARLLYSMSRSHMAVNMVCSRVYFFLRYITFSSFKEF
jgi:hypothetical protein